MLPRQSRLLPLLATLITLFAAGCSEEAMGDFLAGSIIVYIVGGILLFFLVIFALLDLWKKSYPITKKVVWLLIILVVPYIGALLYFLIGRNDSATI